MLAVGVLNTSIGSGNLGDQIIMEASVASLSGQLPNTQLVHFSSHDAFLYNAMRLQAHVSHNFLCGTNCLSSHMLLRPSWAVTVVSAFFIKPVITLGVGWGGYQGKSDLYTRLMLKKVLSKEGLLSVRDEYTKLKLESCGFSNVVNTGCPTLWGLSEEHCDSIPRVKGDKVVYTLTDYARNEALDMKALKVLSKNYRVIFIWPQGTKDLDYLGCLYKRHPAFFDKAKVRLIPPSLPAYNAFLKKYDVDYVGTRLHGGIRALQAKKKTIIIAVDNRAEEMGRDFCLPVIKRENVEGLECLINSNKAVSIKLPSDQINEFRRFIRSTDKKCLNGFSFL